MPVPMGGSAIPKDFNCDEYVASFSKDISGVRKKRAELGAVKYFSVVLLSP